MAAILIIDDDQSIGRLLSAMVDEMGHVAVARYNCRDGLAEVLSRPYDVVFLDVNLPDGSGLDLLPRVRKTNSSPEVIIITGQGDPDGAELAIKNGAWDYVQKPLLPGKIRLPLQRVIQYREGLAQRRTASVALKRMDIAGNSTSLKLCLDQLAQSAGDNTNVLITGETGTGKELFARAIHDNSPWSENNFVVVDCTVLPEKLIESALFGHRKGAFTGADRSQVGMIKQADGGSLFLDEIGELPLFMQKAFLRVLQERRFRPVGGEKELRSDFRLVAATNRDLDAMVRSGQFRSDLLYRVKAQMIKLPPLRERREDIKEIASFHIARFCERQQVGAKGYSPEFMDALISYDWPGNVRELVNTIETALSAARHDVVLSIVHLPMHIRIQLARAAVEKHPDASTIPDLPSKPPGEFPSFRQRLNSVENAYLRELMAMTGGDIQKATHISGLSRSRIYALLKKHNIARRFRP